MVLCRPIPRDLTLVVWDTRRWQQKDSFPLELPFCRDRTSPGRHSHASNGSTTGGLRSPTSGSEPQSPTRLHPPHSSSGGVGVGGGLNLAEPPSPSVMRPGPCVSLIMSPDGKCVASVHTNELVCVWDISTAVRLASKRGRLPVSFSPDGAIVASCLSVQEVQVWEASGGDIKC